MNMIWEGSVMRSAAPAGADVCMCRCAVALAVHALIVQLSVWVNGAVLKVSAAGLTTHQ